MSQTRLVAKLSDGTVLLIEENPDGVFLYDRAQDGSGSRGIGRLMTRKSRLHISLVCRLKFGWMFLSKPPIQ
jgi:hypothetical protein